MERWAVANRRLDLKSLISIEHYESILRTLPGVEAVRRKLRPNGTTPKAEGNHWSPYELEARLAESPKFLTMGVTCHNHGDGGCHIYIRTPPAELKEPAAVLMACIVKAFSSS
jgi:hypothetical protein